MATNIDDRRKRSAAYMREYRKTHPEYTKKEWEQSAVRKLRKLGYTLIAPGERSIRDYVEKLFDRDQIGEKILAEALLMAKQHVECSEAFRADGQDIVGILMPIVSGTKEVKG